MDKSKVSKVLIERNPNDNGFNIVVEFEGDLFDLMKLVITFDKVKKRLDNQLIEKAEKEFPQLKELYNSRDSLEKIKEEIETKLDGKSNEELIQLAKDIKNIVEGR